MPDLPDLGAVYRFEPAPAAGPGDEAEELTGLTVLVLHDAGGDEASLLEAAHRLAPGASVLSPRGPLPAGEGDGDGSRHLPARTEPPPTNPDDPDPHAEAVHQRTGEVAAFLAAACEALDLDPERVCALGFGDGATAAVALAYDHPDALAGVVVLSGMQPFRPPKGRILDFKQIFCATGRADDSVTMDDYEELVEGLVTAGADVELHWYDAGHALSDAELDDAAAWLRKRLGPAG
ncbi:MAG: alpha/beta hydrolase [Acidimicrobiales bacterium]